MHSGAGLSGQKILINKRLRQLEGVFDQVELWPGIVEDDFHDVEAEEDVGIVQQTQPGQRAPGDELLFVPRHGFARRAVAEAAAGFDFDEDEGAAGFVAADEIDLAAVRRAEVAVEDFESLPAEVALRESLTLAAQPLGFVFARLR